MQSYDISHLPPAVHDAVLHLMETLVQAFPSPGEDVTEAAALVPASPQRPTQGTATLPAVVRCPHGTVARPCCSACTVVHRAEAVLVDAQTDVQQHWPRSAVELRILEALQQLAPLPVTPRQVAAMLGLPPEMVRLLLQALATLDTIDHPDMGYYRQKAPAPVHNVSLPVPYEACAPAAMAEAPAPQRGDVRLPPPQRTDPLGQRKALEQQALAILRAAFPGPMSPHELREQLGSAQARSVLMTLVSRGQVQWMRHGRYRYRAQE